MRAIPIESTLRAMPNLPRDPRARNQCEDAPDGDGIDYVGQRAQSLQLPYAWIRGVITHDQVLLFEPY